MRLPLIKFLPGIAWFFIVLYLMCLPGDEIPSETWMTKIYFDKWAHAGVFGLMVVLFCWPFYKSSFNKEERLKYFIKITIAACLWGLAVEFIQNFFVTGREYDLLDWAADSFGAFVAYGFCRKILSKDANSYKSTSE
jgi:VanZ family protein